MLRKIFIDCERMKYKYNGLYYFCLQLGENLSALTDVANEELFFYVPSSARGIFGDSVQYKTQYDYHKLLLPSPSKYNVWHALHQGTNYYPFKSKVKTVLTIHDLNFMHDERKSAGKQKRALQAIRKKIDAADYITTISQFVMDDVASYIDLSQKQTSIIYNGCNINELENLSVPTYQPAGTFLFTIGVVMPKKNFHVLPALLKNNNMQLIIAGKVHDEKYKEQIISEANKHGVANRVIFTGAISENDKQWYYKNCTAFVFPSLAEGFGFPVVEAMYFGKPVILSTHTSLPEIGGDCAYYFESFDADDMQQVLYKSLDNYEKSQRADKIKAQASLFNWNLSAKKYLDIYRSLWC